MSLQAAKGVEIGLGFRMARLPGSQVHDEIFFDDATREFVRRSNNAGGTEGGMTSGAPLVVRVAFKPLSTLMSPLHSVDLQSKEEALGNIERSDVCAIPAAAVIAESVVAFELARGVPREVRRRLPRGDSAELRGLSRAGAVVLVATASWTATMAVAGDRSSL